MKRYCLILVSLIIFLLIPVFSGAATYNFHPKSYDLLNLDHGHYYTWGINWSVPEHEKIVEASLLIEDIADRTNTENDLWGHLLDITVLGVNSYEDTPYTGDEFENQWPLLFHWQNLTNQPQNILHEFDDAQLEDLKTYIGDGYFGLGFDSDCFFIIDTGVTLTIETRTHAPVPASVLLLGSGLLGLVGFRRKTRKSKM